MQEVSLVEHKHINKMHANLKRKLHEATRKDGGRSTNLRLTVLGRVVGEEYDAAIEAITEYVADRTTFPDFQSRADRYIQHGSNLIQAIQIKRGFPGLASLSLSKQQEIHEKVLEHFEELKHCLKQIENLERENRLTDIRSTVWVIKSVCVTVAAILLVWLMIDLQSGQFSSTFKVVNSLTDDATVWLISFINI